MPRATGIGGENKYFPKLLCDENFYWLGKDLARAQLGERKKNQSIFTFDSDTTSWPAYHLILTYWPTPSGLERWDIFVVRMFSLVFEVDDLWRLFLPFSASYSIPAFHSNRSSSSPRHLCHLEKGSNIK